MLVRVAKHPLDLESWISSSSPDGPFFPFTSKLQTRGVRAMRKTQAGAPESRPEAPVFPKSPRKWEFDAVSLQLRGDPRPTYTVSRGHADHAGWCLAKDSMRPGFWE